MSNLDKDLVSYICEVLNVDEKTAIDKHYNKFIEDRKKYELDQEKNNINQESREYLLSTDWYITRQFESGVEVPKDILEKRKEARLKVVD
jgi:hypothetical protein